MIGGSQARSRLVSRFFETVSQQVDYSSGDVVKEDRFRFFELVSGEEVTLIKGYAAGEDPPAFKLEIKNTGRLKAYIKTVDGRLIEIEVGEAAAISFDQDQVELARKAAAELEDAGGEDFGVPDPVDSLSGDENWTLMK